MTMDPATIEAGADLDALIAEHVMGWKRDEPWGPKDFLDTFGKIIGKPILGPWKFGPGPLDARFDEHWQPSTNIAHAWEVVDRVSGGHLPGRTWARGFHLQQMGPALYRVSFCGFDAEAETVPLAICRAALAAVAR